MNHTGSVQLFLDTCHLIHAKGLVSGSGGNISLRCDDGILITPSGRFFISHLIRNDDGIGSG